MAQKETEVASIKVGDYLRTDSMDRWYKITLARYDKLRATGGRAVSVEPTNGYDGSFEVYEGDYICLCGYDGRQMKVRHATAFEYRLWLVASKLADIT